MSWFSAVIGGGIGAMLGGPFGAIIGAAIGSSMGSEGGKKNGHAAPGRLSYSEAERRQALFFTAAFSMVGKLAKADGRVCEDEIAAIRRVSKEVLGLDAQTRQYAISILNQSKVSRESFGDYAREFGTLFWQERDMCTFMMSFLFEVAMADGVLHPSEEQMLLEAKQHFRINDATYQSLRGRFVGSFAPAASLAQHFETLGIDKSAGAAEIKKAYRQKVAEYHPDKIAAKGLPPEFIKFANDKMSEINAAYDAIQKAQGS